ncbi:MAG: hypothetical protein ABGW69_00950 [Nanoarchaeota archaeon]
MINFNFRINTESNRLNNLNKLLFVFIFVLFFFNLTNALEIYYSIVNDVIKLNNNITFSSINISSTDSFKGYFDIYLGNNLKYSKYVELSNSQITLTNVSFKVDKLTDYLYLVLKNDSGNVLNISKRIYIYEPLIEKCKLEDGFIYNESLLLNVYTKFKYVDHLDKKVYLYLNDEEETDYSFSDELKKTFDLPLDIAYDLFSCKVKVVEDDKNVEIYNNSYPILVYYISPFSFNFEDETNLKVSFEDFDLSNKNNTINISIILEGYEYKFNYSNETSIDDFIFNIFDSPNLDKNKDKIMLISNLLEDFATLEGVPIDYRVLISLYNGTKLLDVKKVKDNTYYLKDYEDEGIVRLEDNNDFKLDLINYNSQVEQGDKLKVKANIEYRSGNSFDTFICVAFNGKSYCKKINLNDNDNKEKIINFNISINANPGQYKAFLYAYDKEHNVIKWESFNVDVKPIKGVKLEIEDSLIKAKKGQTTNLSLEVINPTNLSLSGILEVYCNKTLLTKKGFYLNSNSSKEIKIPIKVESDCNGFVDVKGVKLLNKRPTFSIVIIPENNFNLPTNDVKNNFSYQRNSNLNNKKEIECNTDKDLYYSKGDTITLKVYSIRGAKVLISSETNLISVNPSSFTSTGEDKVIIKRKSNETIYTDLIISCEYNSIKKTKDVTIYFYKIEKPFWENKKLIAYTLIGTGIAILVFVIILLFL